ncbi:MAG TPA: hypothetical protein VFS00_34035 [Polyangiaceae bacterium]|nr:hypothetical protein [Polyangiaceae bacterium]
MRHAGALRTSEGSAAFAFGQVDGFGNEKEVVSTVTPQGVEHAAAGVIGGLLNKWFQP